MRTRFKVTVVVDVSSTKEELQTALHHGIWNILDSTSFITGRAEILKSIEVTKIQDVDEFDFTGDYPKKGGTNKETPKEGIPPQEPDGSAPL